jgi:hypothetical protein
MKFPQIIAEAVLYIVLFYTGALTGLTERQNT